MPRRFRKLPMYPLNTVVGDGNQVLPECWNSTPIANGLV